MASRCVLALSLWLACHEGATAQQEANPELVARAKWRTLALTRHYPSVQESLLVTLAACASRREQSSTGAEAHSEIRRQTAEAHIGKGYEDLKDQRYREAAEEFNAALRLAPDLVAVRYQLGVCYFAIGQRKEAREELERVCTETANDPAAIYYLGRLDLVEGDLESAIRRFNSLVSNPPFPDAAYYLGSAYVKKGDAAAAEKWLRKAAELDPRDFRIPDHLARLYQKLGRRQDAEREYARSSERRQRYNDAAQQAIDCSRALDTQVPQEARATCQRLFVPDDPDKLTTLGMLYGKHGDYADAVEPLERAALLDPDSSEVQHNLGLTYFRLRRYADARAALTKAVVLRSDFFGSNALLGATLYALGQDEPAYKILSHAHALNPGDRDTAVLLFKEALILASRDESLKKYGSALGYLQKAAQLQPEDQAVRQRLSDLLQRLGRAQASKPAGKGIPPP